MQSGPTGAERLAEDDDRSRVRTARLRRLIAGRPSSMNPPRYATLDGRPREAFNSAITVCVSRDGAGLRDWTRVAQSRCRVNRLALTPEDASRDAVTSASAGTGFASRDADATGLGFRPCDPRGYSLDGASEASRSSDRRTRYVAPDGEVSVSTARMCEGDGNPGSGGASAGWLAGGSDVADGGCAGPRPGARGLPETDIELLAPPGRATTVRRWFYGSKVMCVIGCTSQMVGMCGRSVWGPGAGPVLWVMSKKSEPSTSTGIGGS